ncbi:MAG: hypothetical protein AAGU19_22415 [Prolixibacteraceae bacterium]
MKKRTNLLIVSAIVLALIVGFVIGLSVEYPRIDGRGVSGTIGKVKNYRNTKATEADIELKNDLVADTAMLSAIRNYMTFHYVKLVKWGENIDFALREALANEAFKNQNASQISALDNYGKLLAAARQNLLMTVMICRSADEASPALLRRSIIQANNSIAQVNYGSKKVISFIDALDAFIQEKGTAAHPELNKAHDLLSINQVGASLLTNDKVVLKYFDKKRLYSKDLKSPGTDTKEIVMRDMESLAVADIETLGFLDAEQLGMWDQEKLGLLDVDNLGGIGALDSEQLAGLVISDSEKLGGIELLDAEQLGRIMDAENLGLKDGENLGMVADAEKLGIGFFDAEKLGSLWDAEKLGTGFTDSEKLGTFMDKESLGIPGYFE